ncbi:MAG: ATP-binding cassette domain-containing protein, partial [Cyclonatronaceae bacterium]
GIRLIEGMIGFQMGMFLLLLAPEFYLPFRSFGSAHHAGMEGAEAGAQLFDMLGEKAESQNQQPSPVKAPEMPLRHIGLDGVSFHYDASQALLSELHLQLQPGEIHALAGRSGSGKTTLMQLLAGFLSPVVGRIIVNDVPLSDISPESWREQVALVTQFPHLISGSLLENIRLGRKNADLKEIEAAVKAAQLDEVAAALPDGLETQLGENGMSLSGGERQRLALARAFLKRAPVLLLDEPAASLNEQLEAELMHSLREMAPGRIILMVTHRRHSLEAADRISILEHGRITQSGAPADVLPGLDSAADDFIRYPEPAEPAGVLS